MAFQLLDPHHGSLGGVHGEDQDLALSVTSVVLLGGFQVQGDVQSFVVDVILEDLDLADLDLLDFDFADFPSLTNTNTLD